MSKQITIRDDIYEKLKELKIDNMSFSDVIHQLDLRSQAKDIQIEEMHKEYQKFLSSLQDATVTHEGRISKQLAGKTILYKIKE